MNSLKNSIRDGLQKKIEKIDGLLPAGGGLRGVVVLVGGTGAAQLLTLLVAPVLTRLYSPEEFGLLGVFVAGLSLLLVLATLGYELAIPMAKDDVSAMGLLVVCGSWTIIFSSAFAIVVYLVGGHLLAFLGYSALTPYLWLFPLSLAGAGFYNALNGWAIRKKAYPQIVQTKFGQAMGQAITQLSFGFSHIGVFGLLVGDVVARVSGSGIFLRFLWRNDKDVLQKVTLANLYRSAIRYRNFPLFSTWSSFLHTAGTVMPTLLLASLYGAAVAGWFTLGQRIIWGPFSLIGQSVASVFVAEAAPLARSSPNELKLLFVKTIKNLLLLSILPVLGIFFLGNGFIFVFGADWVEAGVYMQILSFTFMVQFVVGPVFHVLNLLERQSWLLVCDIVGMSLVVMGIFGAHHMGLSATSAVALYGLATIIMYLILLVAAYLSVKLEINNDASLE